MATIEEPLVSIFMYHRYAVESAASMVAGQDYIYAMRGDNRTPTQGVATDDQRKALDALAHGLRTPVEPLKRRLVELRRAASKSGSASSTS